MRCELSGAECGATIRRATRADFVALLRSCRLTRGASPPSARRAPRGGGGRTPQQPPLHRDASRGDRPCGMTPNERRRRRETKVEPVREHERCVRVAPPDSIAFECHHPLLSVSLRPVARTARCHSARRRRNAAVPSSRVPISRLAVTRFLSSLPSYFVSGVAALDVRLGRLRRSVGASASRATRERHFRVTRCAVPRRARGGRGSRRRRRRGRPGAATLRATRARRRVRRAASSGSGLRRPRRLRGRPRR
jgi:hypothetical protein